MYTFIMRYNNAFLILIFNNRKKYRYIYISETSKFRELYLKIRKTSYLENINTRGKKYGE